MLRPEEADKLITALLRTPEPNDLKIGSAVGITAALRGAGDPAKRKLARWLCQQERIVDHFYDGILWVELGENPETTGSLQGRVEELIRKLRREVTHQDPGFSSAFGAAKRLFDSSRESRDAGTRGASCCSSTTLGASRTSISSWAGHRARCALSPPVSTTCCRSALTDFPVDAMKSAEAIELLTVGLKRINAVPGQINETIKADIVGQPAVPHPPRRASRRVGIAARVGKWTAPPGGRGRKFGAGSTSLRRANLTMRWASPPSTPRTRNSARELPSFRSALACAI